MIWLVLFRYCVSVWSVSSMQLLRMDLCVLIVLLLATSNISGAARCWHFHFLWVGSPFYNKYLVCCSQTLSAQGLINKALVAQKESGHDRLANAMASLFVPSGDDFQWYKWQAILWFHWDCLWRSSSLRHNDFIMIISFSKDGNW